MLGVARQARQARQARLAGIAIKQKADKLLYIYI